MLRFLRGGGKRTKAIYWVITIATVLTFLGGFVFIFGAFGGGGTRTRAVGAVATVDGEPISREDFQTALNDQRTTFTNRYGEEPNDHDLKAIENQAFRGLVLQRLYAQMARKLGIKAHDREVVLALQTSPPAVLQTATAFQTNGKFDPQKYAAALRDPNNNWAPFEQMIRDQLPVRKLQERLFTSVKLTEPELRDYYRDLNERLSISVVSLQPDPTTRVNVTDADIQRVYDRYKNRFTTGAQRQLEVLVVPKQFGTGPIRAASDLANQLVARARRGESFTALSRQYSDAPGADKGGVIDRVLSPSDFGAEMGPKIALLDTGQVTDPVRDGGRFLFFKVLQKLPKPGTSEPGVKVAEIIVRVKPDEDQLKTQADELNKLRNQAQRDGLGRAAATKGASTTKTAYFDLSSTPPALQAAPESADWAFGAKLHQVSPVFEGIDAFVVAQLIGTKDAGPLPKDQITDQLRQLAQIDAAIDRQKPKADGLAAALRAGQTLEQAAAAQGLKVEKIDGVNRAQPDQRLFGQPELVGMLFAAQPGQVVGPVRGLAGYAVARLDQRTSPDWTLFNQQRQQLAQQMLEARQRTFLDNYSNAIRGRASVRDLRADAGY